MSRPRHLERGWCWRADIDGEPYVWGIVGHVPDAEAADIVSAYEEEPVEPTSYDRDWRRSVPCAWYHRGGSCPDSLECDGTHLYVADGPGRGAVAYTWVERAP